MTRLIWQIDLYRRPLRNSAGQDLWELLICDADRALEWIAFCPQSEVSSDWLVAQIQQAIQTQSQAPDVIWVFRPQTLSLVQTAGQALNLTVQPCRRTLALKQWLQERRRVYPQMDSYTGEIFDPIALDSPPPVPLPENLWGDQWQFAALSAGELVEAFTDRPMPFLVMPEDLLPLNRGVASTAIIPGIIINGGRQSLRLAQWLQEVQPAALNYIAGEPDGLILEAGLADRWVLVTFEDAEMAAAAQTYKQRKSTVGGLHFLLVQPDDSGMTYSGFWLLNSL
ncbi:MAG: Tab2/Atab2 family RNA-binding protein [Microcoleaceae cyanobacterium]